MMVYTQLCHVASIHLGNKYKYVETADYSLLLSLFYYFINEKGCKKPGTPGLLQPFLYNLLRTADNIDGVKFFKKFIING